MLAGGGELRRVIGEGEELELALRREGFEETAFTEAKHEGVTALRAGGGEEFGGRRLGTLVQRTSSPCRQRG